MRRIWLGSWIVAALVIAAEAPAITTEEFKLRNAADLVALCSTPTDDPHEKSKDKAYQQGYHDARKQ